ncbi:MAG: hypothetical protein AAGD09_02400 [Cyanobacteria bacterium P01_F01_bin.56]
MSRKTGHSWLNADKGHGGDRHAKNKGTLPEQSWGHATPDKR